VRTSSRSEPIGAVLVAVPARDEAAGVGGCLRSIDAAVRHWGGHTLVVVAADSCDDRTADLARRARVRHVEVLVLEGRWGGAGASRRAAVRAGLARLATAPAVTWIANTDADGAVPRTWISGQVELAAQGADLVLGTVELDAATAPAVAAAFATHYRVAADGHRHVHAANLGIRASAYLSAGGWDERVVVGEEHDLVRRAVALGSVPALAAGLAITTSGRTAGRVEGGFATTLARIAAGGRIERPVIGVAAAP
jgi:glycosyltransferase involved in cell wall biosynthesis